MISIIIEAAENFLHNQIELKTSIEKELTTDMRTVIASIDVRMDDGKTKTVYLGFCEELIKKIVHVYLMDEITDEETMRDMALESTNMIVGSAKVLAEEEKKEHFLISTPIFKAIEEFKTCNCDELSVIKTDLGSLVISIQQGS